ncbi:MAG TPA: thioredoxin-dependent thiol peroxidase [Planctomycetota bacterium]|nr:thioredoxin-dependent thiol peroxidase [Planctomycetota bacterium]
MASSIQVGSVAPDIALPDQDGVSRKLSELRGKWVLVYFYPRDDTPGCTIEACALRDSSAQYAKQGIEVLGISADPVQKHRKFADKFKLPFTLLADEDKRAIKTYGAWGRKKFMGREFDGILRQSFLIDPKGRIAKVYEKVKPSDHAEEVLADVAALSAAKSPEKAAAKKAAKKTAARKAPSKATKPKRPARSR